MADDRPAEAADLALALELADVADSITSSAFGQPIRPETKEDGALVTAADREVEARLHLAVSRRRPGDSFLGEEVGPLPGHADRRWIVDGIDGTQNFVAGTPDWGTLIALEQDGDVVVGVASAPALERRWWAARGQGAWLGPGKESGHPRRLAVSHTANLSTARVVVMPTADLTQVRTGWRGLVGDRIEEACPDGEPVKGHSALMVAEGLLDASVQLWGGPWDHAALAVIVEEAGGNFSNLWGGRRLDTETAIFSNGRLTQSILDLVAELLPFAPN